MSKPVLAFIAVIAIAALTWQQVHGSMDIVTFWVAALFLAFGAALALRAGGGSASESSGEFLCDSCKLNDARYCSRPERPNATRCSDYLPR
jgi:hypothetical protein